VLISIRLRDLRLSRALDVGSASELINRTYVIHANDTRNSKFSIYTIMYIRVP
jgi:hypothetical protein